MRRDHPRCRVRPPVRCRVGSAGPPPGAGQACRGPPSLPGGPGAREPPQVACLVPVSRFLKFPIVNKFSASKSGRKNPLARAGAWVGVGGHARGPGGGRPGPRAGGFSQGLTGPYRAGAWVASGKRIWPSPTFVCRSGCVFGGRESIFKIPHTNEFFGMQKWAQKPAGACGRLGRGRWVYEEGAKRVAGAGVPAQPREPERKKARWFSAGARARLQRPQRLVGPVKGALCGECVRVTPGHLSAVTCKGSLVSIHGLLFLRGSLRSAGGPPLAASTTSGPHPRKARLRGGGIGEDLIRRKGVPHVRRGVGYVGAWPLARLTKSHRGYPPAGEAFRGRTFWQGLLLGRIGGARAVSVPLARMPTALWGIQKKKADVVRGETGLCRTSCAASRAPLRARRSRNFSELFRPETRAARPKGAR